MISLALPRGSSLEKRTLDLFARAGLRIQRPSDHSYRGTITYGDTGQVSFYKPREIPLVVESGLFDAGLTGADWIEDCAAKVEIVESFTYAKVTDSPWRLVLAVPEEHPASSVADLGPGTRVASEYLNVARRFFRDAGTRVELVPSYGATEAKIPELADAVIDVVETGASLRNNGLRILETIRTCTPQVIASPAAWADAGKRDRIRGIARLLVAASRGPLRILLTVRAPRHRLGEVRPHLPAGSWRAGVDLADDDLLVLQGLALREGLPEMIDGLLRAGAIDVIESEVGKVVEVGP
ncbi:ATP phosphoribosyltransferase [Nonomuraea helvata]|uniref:ATP phosphoribosyltransferase n=1 Tax=Nonomuraea helvata TaxID=37484 RepID=A0ABV5SCS3_9ACTN